MPRKLNFESADGVTTVRQWTRRTPNEVIQMSLRMREDVYDRFRKHCIDDRRTNGEMLEIMMQAYEREQRRKD